MATTEPVGESLRDTIHSVIIVSGDERMGNVLLGTCRGPRASFRPPFGYRTCITFR